MTASKWPSSKNSRAIISGAAGAVVVNALHESARQVFPSAPHVDVVGMRALAKPLRWMGYEFKTVGALRKATLIGDLLSNSLYYAVTAKQYRHAWISGALAGIGGVVLPPVLKIGNETRGESLKTSLMTVTWYLVGALAAAAVYRLLENPKE